MSTALTERQPLIMLVDDSPANLELMDHCLAQENVDIAVASDGEQALVQIMEELPDLILTDIMMTGMTGLELCQHLKAESSTREIPVILISSLSDQEDIVKGLKLGAVDYIAKPFHADELRARVRMHLQLRLLTKSLAAKNAALEQEIQQRIAAERALAIQQARVVQLEKQATEVQMAGGFAHEMRNALGSAKLLLARALHDQGSSPPSDRKDDDGPSWSVCLETSQKLAAIFLMVRDQLSPGALDQVAVLLQSINTDQERTDDILRGVKRSLDRGLRITSRILEYAESSSAQPGRQPLDVDALVSNVLGPIAADLASNGISVQVDISPGCVILGGEMHFQSILRNLVLNARDALVETKGDVPRVLSIQATEDDASVVVSVRDTGIGIDSSLHDKIFDPFFTTKLQPGTGFGLGLARKLTSLYGGTIEIDSAASKGATFRIVLPKERGRAGSGSSVEG